MTIPSRSRGMLTVGVLVSLALTVGCARPRRGEQPTPQFSAGPRTVKPMASDPMSGADQPGPLYDNTRLELAPAKEVNGGAPQRQGPMEQASGSDGLSKTVQENVTGPGASAGAATRPANGAGAAAAANGVANGGAAAAKPPPPAQQQRPQPHQQGAAVGQFFVIGGVVAEVNGTPIYANKVLNLIEPILAARAKELDAERFKLVADKELKTQRNTLINHELEYAAAERNLDARDKDMAWTLTMNWKLQQITQAGGSEELARKNAPQIARENSLNPDASFDELVQEMYRVWMSRVFYQKKIMPRIQLSAAEMREYYDRNRTHLFTTRADAQFRLIKIDKKKAGGREPAMDKIVGLRNRIVRAGESFESIARTTNDNPLLLKTGGQVTVDRGAFAVKEVDDAVWSTPQGQVTEVIETGDALYIAQVMERKPAAVQSFEEEAVQVRIKDDLFSRDFKEMRRKVLEQLEKDAVIRSDPSMMNTALEMAMQNYSRWAGK